ncbi:MAG: hypothetical protein ACRC5A_05430, partial [Enterobacteriaceae bacterium]
PMTEQGNVIHFDAAITPDEVQELNDLYSDLRQFRMTLVVLSKNSDELAAMLADDEEQYLSLTEVIADYCETANNLLDMSKTAFARLCAVGGMLEGGAQ